MGSSRGLRYLGLRKEGQQVAQGDSGLGAGERSAEAEVDAVAEGQVSEGPGGGTTGDVEGIRVVAERLIARLAAPTSIRALAYRDHDVADPRLLQEAERTISWTGGSAGGPPRRTCPASRIGSRDGEPVQDGPWGEGTAAGRLRVVSRGKPGEVRTVHAATRD